MVRRDKRKKGMTRWKKVVIAVAVVIIALFLFREPIMIYVGSALVAQDKPRDADAIVVLMGSVPDRVAHGTELYKKGYADRILMVRTGEYEDYEVMETMDLEVPGTVDINVDIARQMGVPEEDITVIEYGSDSTFDEAVAVKEYLKGKDKESLIVVTSKYHSARAEATFERVLDGEVEIISSPSPYDPFDAEKWWKERAHTRSVILEYQKLLNLYLFQW